MRCGEIGLHSSLNDALREEVQRLKIATGQAVPNGGQMMNFGSSFGINPQFYSHNHAAHTLLAAHQFQQLQIHSQQQQQQQHQQAVDLRSKGALSSQNQRENVPDFGSSSKE